VSPDPVQAQLDACNTHDVEAFAGRHAVDVKLFDAAGKLVVDGTDALRTRHEALFDSSPQRHAQVTQRTGTGCAQAWYVFDTEHICGRNEPGSPRQFEVIALYCGRGSVIREVRLLAPRVPLPD
jgi:hypothetical protein